MEGEEGEEEKKNRNWQEGKELLIYLVAWARKEKERSPFTHYLRLEDLIPSWPYGF